MLRRPVVVVAFFVLIASSVPGVFGASPDGRTDINEATAEDLMKVNGIGQKTSAKILAHRDDAGGYRRLRDIMGVKGIGKITYEKLACYFYIPAEGVLPCGQKNTSKLKKEKPSAPVTVSAQGTKININTADVEQLCQLPGIGPKKAERIAEYRRTHGWFESVDKLDEISGFGEKTVARLAPMVETHVCFNTASINELRALGFANATAILRFRKVVGPFVSVEDLKQIPETDEGVVVEAEDILRFGNCP
jgi:comEA protein